MVCAAPAASNSSTLITAPEPIDSRTRTSAACTGFRYPRSSHSMPPSGVFGAQACPSSEYLSTFGAPVACLGDQPASPCASLYDEEAVASLAHCPSGSCMISSCFSAHSTAASLAVVSATPSPAEAAGAVAAAAGAAGDPAAGVAGAAGAAGLAAAGAAGAAGGALEETSACFFAHPAASSPRTSARAMKPERSVIAVLLGTGRRAPALRDGEGERDLLPGDHTGNAAAVRRRVVARCIVAAAGIVLRVPR